MCEWLGMLIVRCFVNSSNSDTEGHHMLLTNQSGGCPDVCACTHISQSTAGVGSTFIVLVNSCRSAVIEGLCIKTTLREPRRHWTHWVSIATTPLCCYFIKNNGKMCKNHFFKLKGM